MIRKLIQLALAGAVGVFGIWLSFVSASPHHVPEERIWDVAALAEADAMLHFTPFDADLYLYEPLAGELIIRNEGGQAFTYKKALLTGSGIVIKMKKDDTMTEVKFRDAFGGHSPTFVTLRPGEDHRRFLVFDTARGALSQPGECQVAFALVDNGELMTDWFNVTVSEPPESEAPIIEAMIRLNPRAKNPVHLPDHLSDGLGDTFIDEVTQIVLANPDSLYAAYLAKDLSDYFQISGTGDRQARRETFLRIAAKRNEFVFSHLARSELASLVSRSSVKVRLQMGRKEAHRILETVQKYFDGLIAGDITCLTLATDLEVEAAKELLDTYNQELQEEGVDVIRSVNVPQSSQDIVQLQLIDTEHEFYRVKIKGIKLGLLQIDGTEKILTVSRGFKLRRHHDGRWTIVTSK